MPSDAVTECWLDSNQASLSLKSFIVLSILFIPFLLPFALRRTWAGITDHSQKALFLILRIKPLIGNISIFWSFLPYYTVSMIIWSVSGYSPFYIHAADVNSFWKDLPGHKIAGTIWVSNRSHWIKFLCGNIGPYSWKPLCALVMVKFLCYLRGIEHKTNLFRRNCCCSGSMRAFSTFYLL